MNKIELKNFHGYVTCKYKFGEHSTVSNSADYTFEPGVTLLRGSIDEGAWAISYIVSMYNSKDSAFTVFWDETKVLLDGTMVNMKEVQSHACYLDKCDPLFSTKKTVRKLVEKGLKKQKDKRSADEIRDLFYITPFRFDKPLRGVGNERFRCMAAIGYANGKDIFCFPWFSKRMIIYYGRNITDVLEILDSLKKIVLLPTEFAFPCISFFNKVYNFDLLVPLEWKIGAYKNDSRQ